MTWLETPNSEPTITSDKTRQAKMRDGAVYPATRDDTSPDGIRDSRRSEGDDIGTLLPSGSLEAFALEHFLSRSLNMRPY